MGKTNLKKLNVILRVMIIVVALLVTAFLCISRLTKIQVVDAESYLDLSQKRYTATQSIQAARGQISDINGTILNGNRIVYKVIIQRSFLPRGRENEVIAKTIDILEICGDEWFESIPISTTMPYRFTASSDTALDAFKQRIQLNPDATVENCLEQLYSTYEIDESFDEQTRRLIAGVRYEMTLRDFSQLNRYTFAEDISIETVIQIKENSSLLPGVDIIEESIRQYNAGEIAPHIRGTVSSITAEQYVDKAEQGYSINDTLGEFGIESAMEGVLRGENGVRTITRDSKGAAISDEVTTGVKPGNSVKLTLNSDFQTDLQEMVVNHLNWLYHIEETEQDERWQRGQNTQGISVVVLDAKTGAVRGMVSYPWYDLNDYVDNYYSVLTAEKTPLFNRAISGLYRPGSTFKTITGISGLYNNIITSQERIECAGKHGKYTFFETYQPSCTCSGGVYDIFGALKISCNTFFYDVGRRTGIDNMADTAGHFGIGTNLGLEIGNGGEAGRMTTPETYNMISEEEFTGGDVIQAAIGQSETLLTPLHLAVQAMTFANKGVRYRPYLVDSIWDYNLENLVYKTEPEVVDTFYQDKLELFDIIEEGMIQVSSTTTWPPYSGINYCYDYLPEGNEVASKTGTPQVTTDIFNSTVLGYYPADDPQIAFGIVAEDSDWTRYLIRNIIDSYFYDAYEPDMNEEGIVVSPWKRWDEAKQARIMSTYE